MKHVDIETAVAAATEIPAKKAMTRAEKLKHWAGLVRSHGSFGLRLYHKLEDRDMEWLRVSGISPNDPTAFAMAVRDSVLQAEGLPARTNILGIMQFFELTQDQLHEFSCDCGGAIDNEQMASRIENIADGGGGPSLVTRAMSRLWFGF